MKMYLIVIALIMFMIKMLTYLTNKTNITSNFSSSLESGFNNMNNLKMNLSMNFTFILMIFILFDIELMMFIPLMINLKISNTHLIITIMFIMFIISTTLVELKNSKIKWVI